MTKRQYQTLQFIIAYQAEHGFCPSYLEIAAHFGSMHKSGVHRLICALEERGYIARLPHRARALTVLRGVDGQQVAA